MRLSPAAHLSPVVCRRQAAVRFKVPREQGSKDAANARPPPSPLCYRERCCEAMVSGSPWDQRGDLPHPGELAS